MAFSSVPKLTGSFTLDPPSVGANTVTEVTVTIKGANPANDFVLLNPPALATGLHFVSARVSAADTVAIKLWNSTAAAIDDTAKTWRFEIL